MTDDPKTPRPPLLKSQTRQANWRRANLSKYTAHLAVQRALVSGKLEKQGCEVCGHEVVDAHHDSYDEPLNVRWLCRRHHIKLHHYGEDMFPVRYSIPKRRASED
ncbi:hypothetical protein [Paracoccus sp. (in: a-proteobacteria)]|uniref:hypothetical protein n=1 Tax=Paracoccus sp. TaxID=267 RepID=UPI00289B9B21|nr:hypothetical protein [Paracoccus sp. (in: a-proteobacteria)]